MEPPHIRDDSIIRDIMSKYKFLIIAISLFVLLLFALIVISNFHKNVVLTNKISDLISIKEMFNNNIMEITSYNVNENRFTSKGLFAVPGPSYYEYQGVIFYNDNLDMNFTDWRSETGIDISAFSDENDYIWMTSEKFTEKYLSPIYNAIDFFVDKEKKVIYFKISLN
ncbi:MAG: hypothetical protein PHR14_07350 [Oscillospiraceae bacterium]|jgi:hypothetical protein|nr:hypothetical protein [Oscillospiraceae bacterium]